MRLNLTGTFKLHENYDWGKAKKGCISKKAVECFKILRERLFFDIGSPLIPTFDEKKTLVAGHRRQY